MKVYYFNTNLLARAFVFSDITERLKTNFHILCPEALCLMKSKCQNFQRRRLNSDPLILWLRDVHENQYA